MSAQSSSQRSVRATTASEGDAIRPFRINVPEAEFEQPKLFSEELHAGFRSLRNAQLKHFGVRTLRTPTLSPQLNAKLICQST